MCGGHLVPKVVNQLVAAAVRYAEVLLKSKDDTSEVLGPRQPIADERLSSDRRRSQLDRDVFRCPLPVEPTPSDRSKTDEIQFMYVQVWTVLSCRYTIKRVVPFLHHSNILYKIYTLDMTSTGQFQTKNIRKLECFVAKVINQFIIKDPPGQTACRPLDYLGSGIQTAWRNTS